MIIVRRVTALRYFQYVESEFRLYVGQLILFIGDRVAVFLFQLGIEDRNGAICADGVAFCVSGVMRESSERERVAIQVLRVTDEGEDEIPAAHVVRQVAEEKTSVRIISHVLDDGPAIGVAVCFFKLFGCSAGKAFYKQWA